MKKDVRKCLCCSADASSRGSLRVVIVGKPNVGKSTLFNRLCGKKLAIACDHPGTTRDYREYVAHFGGLTFTAVDTAGWEFGRHKEVESVTNVLRDGDACCGVIRKMALMQVEKAIASADVIMFVVDAVSGISQDDVELARLIRKSGKSLLLIVNKTDGDGSVTPEITCGIYELGFGQDPVFISALHGCGIDGLYGVLCKMLRAMVCDGQSHGGEITKYKHDQIGRSHALTVKQKAADLSVAIVGRPNVGKSTLFNVLVGEERAIVSDIAGTTKDCIEQNTVVAEKMLIITDTAGMRRRGRIEGEVEDIALSQSITAIRRSSVILLVMDATQVLTHQDIAIAKIAINEGKAIIFVINKVDLVVDKSSLQRTIMCTVEHNLRDVCSIPVVYISAIQHNGIAHLVDTIFLQFKAWGQLFSTSELNRWLSLVVEKHMPPRMAGGRRLKLKYITQKATRPPTFIIFSNFCGHFSHHYKKYVYKSLSKHFGLDGIPIRLLMNKAANPYVAQDTQRAVYNRGERSTDKSTRRRNTTVNARTTNYYKTK